MLLTNILNYLDEVSPFLTNGLESIRKKIAHAGRQVIVT